ncbi:r3h and g-patch domain-containing protein [Diplodia corticola]|uniref:Protein SQS1 n=1 Tax=Diplodia corticola TaxID=236234 RepID=A0A1J9R3D5_9PEZI|nr:r3h and g-patch domain-containing protein [Diplodia corticola]OJD34738.1 r3h and g-patch domain-containing protein [Diplodia corticola]
MVNHARKGGGHRGSRRGRGGSRGTSTPRSFARTPIDAPSAQIFSLQEEARNTEHRHHLWSSEVKLRHKGISFVSAGNLAGTLPEESGSDKSPLNESTPDAPTPNESLSIHDEPIADAIARSENAMAQMHLEPTVEATVSPPASALFFEDTVGSSSLAIPQLPPPVIRNASPTPSDSSEEIVLFRGRNNVSIVTDSVQPVQTSSEATAPPAKNLPVEPAAPSQPTRKVQDRDTSARRSPRQNSHHRYSSEPDDEALADYIENIQAQEYDDAGELVTGSVYATSRLTQRALGLMDDHELEDAINQSAAQTIDQKNPHKTDWDSSHLEDFDNISTSSEVFVRVDRILRKRTRSSGLQYLVVFDNSDEDEARWIPVSRLTREHDKNLVAAFEETIANVTLGNEPDTSETWSDESVNDDDDDDDDDDEDEDDDDDVDLEDEEDLIQRRIERMSDEKLARLFAKQEELGIGSNDLLLFDGDDDDDIEIDDLGGGNQHHVLPTTRGRKQKSKSKRAGGSFPSATLMADVLEQDPYDGFDIMDFERPSLKKKKKGRAVGLPFDLSDDDLSAQLVTSWENDRDKKRLKKQERAELRSQGLLGKKNKFKADLNAKYNEGMTFTQIREEIKVFLDSSSQSRPFPPMDKRDRAALHQLAGALGLTSRSIGSGTSRFTTLIKTSRTKELNEMSFAKITARYQNRFLQRMDKRDGGKRSGGGGGGGRYAAVSYQDGDVVGASAPEIGSDNKGRAMLEKMGWSSGTALGAINNKGILQPVTHVVKTTKTGLG